VQVLSFCKVKVKECPEGEQTCSFTLSLTSALDGSGRVKRRPSRFTPGNDPISSVQEARWAPGPV
jgi:hypothetical protein